MEVNRLRAYRLPLGIGLSLIIAGLAMPSTARAFAFPADGAWNPLTRSAVPIGDPAGDTSTAVLDVVGNAEYPMAFVQSDATHLYFRLRIDHEVLQTATNLKPYGWGCVIDIDGDSSTFEYSAILDGVYNPDAVTLWENLVQEMPDNPGDMLPKDPLFRYLGPLDPAQPGYGYARQILAGTSFGSPNPDPDYFADWAVERSKLAPRVGQMTPLRFACGSASAGENLNQDFSGPAHLPDLFSDPILCDDLGCHPQTCAGFGMACAVGVGGCAGAGTMVCLNNLAVCNAVAGSPSPEICNGVDDDCDGSADEDFGLGASCSAGIGACMSSGEIACVADGTAACNAIASPPVAEKCGNDIDDDCDGVVDNGFNLGEPCSVGVGLCVAMGKFVCAADGSAMCNAVPGTPADELCGNDIDEDCDGLLDNGSSLGESCSVGIGSCIAVGQFVCTADGTATCNAVPGIPADELCGNNVDEDCDGLLDNGCPIVDPDAGVPPECKADSDCAFGSICVDAACVEGCRGENPVACPVGEVCSTTGAEPGHCEADPRNTDIIVEGGGCACQTGSSRSVPLGIAWTIVLTLSLVLRRKKH